MRHFLRSVRPAALQRRQSRRCLKSLAPAVLLLAALTAGLYGCAAGSPAPTAAPSATPPPSATHSPAPSVTVSPSITARPHSNLPVWENFPAPQLTAVTAIPPPLTGLVVPEEVQVMAIAGIDRPGPFSGRTDAIALVIYHPRLARASVISIPPDLFGYIPGYTMQRMSIAYAVGGPRRLTSALEYNFGLAANQYAVLNLDDFSQIIDDLGGINVTVLENLRKYCPTISTGMVLMGGEEALCYMRLRFGEDEAARNRRQQEIFRTVFLRLVEGGNLVRVPELYSRHRSAVDSNLTLEQILDSLPLALKLGDPSRIGYFQLGPDEVSTWKISDHPPAIVFLPNRPAVMALMQQAVNFVTTPSPLQEIVLTLEYQLTISPTPTNTYTVTPTPTSTATPIPTLTPTRTITLTRAPTNTRTVTPTRTSTRTVTPTLTLTPSPTETQTPTETTPAP